MCNLLILNMRPDRGEEVLFYTEVFGILPKLKGTK